MPRNGSGVSSVVNTFVIDTVADPDEVNANFTDVADQLTNSLPRDGQAGMNAPLPLQNGTAALPALTFSSDTNTGIYRKSADTVAISGNGVDIAVFSPTGVSVTGSLASTTVSGEYLRGYLNGLTLSNNVSDATNDIDIAAGSAASDGTTPVLMTLASALTKRLDAAWAVGTNSGGLDTGSIANTTYHVWLIQRSDTGVVDALFSTSATSPTMPTSYDRKRRIGAIIRVSAAILLFSQLDDEFLLTTSIRDINTATLGTTATLFALSVPTGIKVRALMSAFMSSSSAGQAVLVTSPDETDQAVGGGILDMVNTSSGGTGETNLVRRTNTSGQIRARASLAATTLSVRTFGWIDTRGRF